MRDNQNNLLNQCKSSYQKLVLPKDILHKDVVIIGNGPSGIALSLMLAGHWPYWNPERIQQHPDELLKARLQCADSSKSLVEQDLEGLSDGLEGRSTNPVSLLLDNLNHPCADLGVDIPSMLLFKYHPEKEINHIVLGKGAPGGSWHKMDPNLRTLSLAAWMSLPEYEFNTWLRKKSSHETKLLLHNGHKSHSEHNKRNSRTPADSSAEPGQTVAGSLSQTRALISNVAEYYEAYVKEMNLDKYFWNDIAVTNVMPIRIINPHTKVLKSCRWLVIGMRNGKLVQIACKNVVLANGSSDIANRLGLPAERMTGGTIPWVKYELTQLEASLRAIPKQNRAALDPVLIIGAGLSAADAVTICRTIGLPVIHVYRNRTAGLDKMLPENVYPEYHEVHKMMKNPNKYYEHYTPLPEHTIADFVHESGGSGGGGGGSSSSKKVILRHLKTGELKAVKVSFCVILIGSRPDLRFLNYLSTQQQQQQLQRRRPTLVRSSAGNPPVECMLEDENPFRFTKQLTWFKILCAKCRHINFCERIRRRDYKAILAANETDKCECPTTLDLGGGHCVDSKTNPNNDLNPDDEQVLGIGEDPTRLVDAKSNPIAVDKFSNRVLHSPKGLYAMGPLVGDNFVRFIPGGALAITSALQRRAAEENN